MVDNNTQPRYLVIKMSSSTEEVPARSRTATKPFTWQLEVELARWREFEADCYQARWRKFEEKDE